MSTHDEKAMQALSDAGAQCGACGDEPGDRTCPDCEHCCQQYVAALRAAGWGPRAEALREAADAVSENLQDTPEYGEYIANFLRCMADEATTGGAS